MFSGIVAGSFSCLEFKNSQITFEIPSSFKKLLIGDSVSVDGVCLTVEELKKGQMIFSLGVETLKITKWNKSSFKNKKFNLENSLTLNQALGGHFVTGHVDGLAHVLDCKKEKGSLLLTLKLPEDYIKFFSSKSYITLNGVSLTVNAIHKNQVDICVIPKTQELSNLSQLKRGDSCLFEVDYFSRILMNYALNNKL